ncbi:helicase-exonuclease AddAB subunit AddB [Paenibacillus sp.]|uniref:helicase-exonuclease AddAB subunit AddB n=1 Tax=Paenibacillus sp. TaxID=58172 RepID=UPI002D281ADA|nr:helicase-exonuclease AddAB subunit AddB [Paenibacillus sp.]HZG57397.1 helicase-exonuclease AddAB subunit AddB [Paenibacillus sp.]
MGIRFALGRAGSGKSRLAFERIGAELERAPDGPPLVLLVPEQMTQAADRAFAARFGGTIRAQSLSFRRLAFRVMQEVGGAARLHIDDTGKKMLLYKIAKSRAKELRAFRRLTESGGWIDAALEWYDECKRYNVDGARLREAADEPAFPPALRDKLHDLSLLAEDMERELSGAYVDSEDYLALLAAHAGASRTIREARFWVDGFHGFTPSELAVLRALCKHAAGVEFALTLDRAYAAGETPDELDLFHPTASTYASLIRLAAEEGVPVEGIDVVDGRSNGRFAQAPALAALERAFVDRANGRPFAPVLGAEAAVSLVAAANPRAEAEACARDIVRLVSSGAARWRDVAVFVRDWEGYGEVIAAAFQAYGIPCFLDQKRAVTHHPLSELIRSALDVVSSSWSYDAVFRAVKSELLFPPGTFRTEAEQRFAMDQLENVVLEYGIHGARWTDGKPWRLSAAPLEGDAAADDERARAREERIHRWRELVAAPLRAFERRLKKAATMREQAEALYQLLEETGAADTLSRWREAAERDGLPERAREHDQLWDRVIDTLDQLVELVGEEPADAELFAGMIASGLDGIRMGLVPPALDQALVGSLDRTRAFGIKKLYLLGVNDGVIPMRPKEKGVVSEAERERLLASGLELAPDSRRRLLDERFLLYNALFLPSEALWIGYSLSDPEGKALLPSEWIAVIKQLAPSAAQRFAAGDAPADAGDDEALERLVTPSRAVTELMPQLRRWKKGEPVNGVWWAAYNWLAERPYWRERLLALLPSLDYANRERPLSAETAVALYGEPFASSVSRLEQFAGCPFAHFAAYGLRLRERRLYRLEAPDIGQLYHAALSRLSKRLAEERRTWADMDAEECAALASLAVDELAPRLVSEILFSSNRHRYVTRKLKAVVGRAAEALRAQAMRSGFRQAAAELAFGEEGGLPPLRLTLPDGRAMELRGRIDRIDEARAEGGGRYVRVVDYKSRAHRLRLSDVYYGLSLQLLAYLDAATEEARAWLGDAAEPAGALYFHVHKPILTLANAAPADQVEAELFKKFKMSGLLSSETEAAALMDTSLAQGISPIVPLERKVDGSLGARSKAVDAERWSRLRAFVRSKMTELGARVADGEIEAAPYRSKQETPCAFCRYKPVCAFDPELGGNVYRTLPPLADEDVWSRISSAGGSAERPGNGKEDGGDAGKGRDA